MAKRKRINKKKLIFVILVLVFVLYLVFRIISGIGNFIEKKRNPEPIPRVKTAEEIQEEENRKINIIIDPAKGGKEKGLVGFRGSQYEKDLNLDIAKLVEANLSKHSDVNVKLTRSYDNSMTTAERVKFAKKNKGDILVSIRINAQAGSNEASGMDVYYSNPNSASIAQKSIIDEENQKNNSQSNNGKVADKSSDKINDKNSDDKYGQKSTDKDKDIGDNKGQDDKTGDTQNNVRQELSKSMAEQIQSTSLSFVQFKDRGIREATYDILGYAEMPSVIVHTGFITNKEDVEILETPSTREELANGISEGILRFIDQNRKNIIKDRINFR